MAKQIQTEGIVEKIYFEDGNFNIFSFIENETGKRKKAKSYIPVEEEMQISITGVEKINKYGKTIDAKSIKEIPFKSKSQIIRYLSSKLFDGIGEKYAEKIVNEFGIKTMEILEKDVTKVESIKGLGDKKIKAIKKGIKEKSDFKKLVKFASKYNIKDKTIIKIYEENEEDITILEEIKKNPYILIKQKAFGFKKADKIAMNMGIKQNAEIRINAFIYEVMKREVDGNTILKISEVESKIKEKLKISYNIREKYKLNIFYKIFNKKTLETAKEPKKNQYIALYKFLDKEKKIDQKIKSITQNTKKLQQNNEDLENIIKDLEKEQGFKYIKEQKETIKKAVLKKLSVITGKAGTGKTTISKAILTIYRKQNKSVLVLAPTGKAAKRITNTTGFNASTIHLAKLSQNIEIDSYDAVMVDEAGMLSTNLANILFEDIQEEQSVILIGDIAQIPPVEPGNIFRDILHNGGRYKNSTFSELSTNHRTKNNDIKNVANKIAKGEIPEDKELWSKKIKLIETPDYKIPQTINNLIKGAKEKLNLTFNDIQVLSPQYRGTAGVNLLNSKIQKEFNKNDVLINDKFNERVIKKNDKIMQIKNNYDKAVFNGETLFIKKKEKRTEENELGRKETNEIITAEIKEEDGKRTIKYKKNDFFKETTLSYACTIHKMQGSETNMVIYVVSNKHRYMLNRNIAYTAITRGKQIVAIVGQKSALEKSIKNEVSYVRKTYIKLLNEKYKEEKKKDGEKIRSNTEENS